MSEKPKQDYNTVTGLPGRLISFGSEAALREHVNSQVLEVIEKIKSNKQSIAEHAWTDGYQPKGYINAVPLSAIEAIEKEYK